MDMLSKKLLKWYDQHARVMPWRNHPDPYAVWVSEIMLQQTRVDTVIPYFEKWMQAFPTLQTLAAASEQKVLSLWEGLGYYSRARNLHKAAQKVVSELDGNIPTTLEGLRNIPGIGAYTAAAIASIAFGQDVATLDGNIRRIFARLFNVSEAADSPSGTKILWALAEKHLLVGRAGDYNQALMDLGATICLPKNPLCEQCPLGKMCQARDLSIQNQRPVLKPKVVIPLKLKAAAVIVVEENVLLTKRPAKGLLAGMWEFPAASVDADSAAGLIQAIQTEYKLVVCPLKFLIQVKHAYTHFRLIEDTYLCELAHPVSSEMFEWVAINKLSDYPMGKVDRQIANKIMAQQS